MSKSKSVKKSKSINLYPVGGDNSDSDKEEDENDTERIIEESKAKSEKEGVWNVGGVRKNNLIAQVINLSSKFVSSELEQVTLPNGETTLNKIYTALPDAAQVAYDLKKLVSIRHR